MSRFRDIGPRPLPAGMPRPVQMLAAHLQRLPGVGEKTSQRYALALATGDAAQAAALAEGILAMLRSVHTCPRCGGLADAHPCGICSDSKRDDALLCVVGRQVDLMAIERSGAMRGRYFVLGRLLNPLEGVGLDELPVGHLRARLLDGVQEVLLALPSSVEGQATAMALGQVLRDVPGVRWTRIAQGVSAGADLEYADALTLSAAIGGRSAVT
jgi:recombination protein RecR